MGHVLRTERPWSSNPRHLDEDDPGRSWRPLSISWVPTNTSSWDLAHARTIATFGPFLCEHESVSLRYTRLVFGPQQPKSGSNLTSWVFATRYVHHCRSVTATHLQALLNAQLVPSWMKRNSRCGVPSGENGFKTQRVERVVCGPVVMQGDDRLGAESRSEGIKSHNYLDCVTSGEGYHEI